jgi:hypothetical protein
MALISGRYKTMHDKEGFDATWPPNPFTAGIQSAPQYFIQHRRVLEA